MNTYTLKFPKFFRCKSRKRYKKLLMSIGLSRNFIESYLNYLESLSVAIPEYNYSYQELWDEVRRAVYGF